MEIVYVGVFQSFADAVRIGVGDPALGDEAFSGAIDAEHVQSEVDCLEISSEKNHLLS